MFVLSVQKQALHHVVFSPDGATVAAAGERGGYYWPAPSDQREGSRLGESLKVRKKPFSSIGFTRNGEYLIGGLSLDGVLSLHRKEDRYQFLRIPGRVVCVEPSPTEPLLFVCNTVTGVVSRWEIGKAGKFIPGWTAAPNPRAASGQPAFSRAGTWFAHPAALTPTSHSFNILIRGTATGELLNNLQLADYILGALAISPDGKAIAYRCNDRIGVTEVASSGARVARIYNDNRKHFTGVAFHPSGRYLAATSNDATVKLFDTTTWEVARAFTWDIGRMRSIAFSPDGTLAAAGSDSGKVVVWDVDL